MKLKNIFHWKVIFTLTMVLVVLSLAGFIYGQQMKLPSEDWSLGIPIDQYELNTDFDSLIGQNTKAFGLPSGELVNTFILGQDAVIRKFNEDFTLMGELTVPLSGVATQMNGKHSESTLELTAFVPESQTLHFITLDTATMELIKEENTPVEAKSVKLAEDQAVVVYEDRIERIIDGQTQVFDISATGRIELANVLQTGSEILVATVQFEQAKYKIYASTLTPDGEVHTVHLADIPSRSTIVPINIEMSSIGDEQTLVTTSKDNRFGVNYVTYATRQSDGTYKVSDYEISTYLAVPYFVQNGDQVQYLMNFWNANLGRSELSRGFTSYQNLYLIDPLVGQPKQLTISQTPSIKPSYFNNGDYAYLVYNEHREGKNTVYVSSNNPALIDRSVSITPGVAADVFSRTLSVYPAVLMSGLVTSMISIFFIAAFVLPVMMFAMRWAENNKRFIAIMSIVLYLGSQIFWYHTVVFKGLAENATFPAFIGNTTTGWIYYGLLTALTFYCFWDRYQRQSKKNEYFLKSIGAFVVMHLLATIFFFLPYSMI